MAGLVGAGAPNANGFETSAPWLPVDGPPNSVAGEDTAGVEGAPNVNAGLFSAGVVTGGVDGGAPKEKGDFAAGVTGEGAEGAVDPKLNPPLPPEEVEGNRGFGASIEGVEAVTEGVPNVNAGLGASVAVIV